MILTDRITRYFEHDPALADLGGSGMTCTLLTLPEDKQAVEALLS